MTPRLILCAGIPRSGSTWLYNAVRLLLATCGDGALEAAWIEDYNPASPAALHLVKLHEPAPELLGPKSLVLTSHRDLRDIAGSVRRMKWAESDEGLLTFLDGVVTQHRFWAGQASYEMVYEAMIGDRGTEILKIAEALGLFATAENLHDILSQIENLQHAPGSEGAYDKLSLLHHAHRGKGQVAAYAEALPAELIARIEQRFGDWMSAQGYL